MSIEQARSFLLWCSILNYGFLLIWVLAATVGRKSLCKLKARFFNVTDEQFDVLNMWGITFYKAGTFFFNIMPCIALYIVK